MDKKLHEAHGTAKQHYKPLKYQEKHRRFKGRVFPENDKHYLYENNFAPFSGVVFQTDAKFKSKSERKPEVYLDYIWDGPSMPYVDLHSYADIISEKEKKMTNNPTNKDLYSNEIRQESNGTLKRSRLGDPLHRLNANHRMVEIMGPNDNETEKKFNEYSEEMENYAFVKPNPLLVPLPLCSLDFIDNYKLKRNLLSDNNYNFDTNLLNNSTMNYAPGSVEEDICPCTSCGGKNKKPQGKSGGNIVPRDNVRNYQGTPNAFSHEITNLPSDPLILQGSVKVHNPKRNVLSDSYNFDSMKYSNLNLNSAPRSVEEDTIPCTSCGGKNKKPQDKTGGNIMPRENTCNCQKNPKECTCASQKASRSIPEKWYSVFNMSAPLPFLTTKLRIFRKRRNIWVKIVPSIT